jgi:hypothetical protein
MAAERLASHWEIWLPAAQRWEPAHPLHAAVAHLLGRRVRLV